MLFRYADRWGFGQLHLFQGAPALGRSLEQDCLYAPSQLKQFCDSVYYPCEPLRILSSVSQIEVTSAFLVDQTKMAWQNNLFSSPS